MGSMLIILAWVLIFSIPISVLFALMIDIKKKTICSVVLGISMILISIGCTYPNYCDSEQHEYEIWSCQTPLGVIYKDSYGQIKFLQDQSDTTIFIVEYLDGNELRIIELDSTDSQVHIIFDTEYANQLIIKCIKNEYYRVFYGMEINTEFKADQIADEWYIYLPPVELE